MEMIKILPRSWW